MSVEERNSLKEDNYSTNMVRKVENNRVIQTQQNDEMKKNEL